MGNDENKRVHGDTRSGGGENPRNLVIEEKSVGLKR